jgi:hypothetical protein
MKIHSTAYDIMHGEVKEPKDGKMFAYPKQTVTGKAVIVSMTPFFSV